jgi:putative flippase GtrA
MMRTLMTRFYVDRTWPFQLARYLTIGGIVFCIDVGSFAALLRAGIPLLVTTTISYGLGIGSHFTLNKYVNFRAHDRPVHSQAITYAAVAFVCWLTTLGIVKGAVLLGAPPLGGKLLAIAFNLPLGFLGHRYLTFGRGIVSAIRGLSERPPT